MTTQMFPPATGTFWRADTGYRHGRMDSVYDVIKFETDELGNGNDFKHITEETLLQLKMLHASRCVWVTKKKGDALIYGRPESYNVGEGAVILAEDRCRGYLVLLKPVDEDLELSPLERLERDLEDLEPNPNPNV
jgi:hypothetical protein